MVPVFIVTVAVGVQDRPSTAPKAPAVWVSDYKITNNPSFTEAVTAVSSLIFAYACTPTFFGIAAEMRDPHLYTRSLVLCQSVVTATYIIIGCVLYYYCGSYVASPALGSAGPTIKKISYGLALPGLLATMTIISHVNAHILPPHAYLVTDNRVVSKQVHFRPDLTWIQASHCQYLC